MENRLETAGILRRAADVMIKGGYVKGMRHNANGAHCALGALDVVLGKQRRLSIDDNPAVVALSEMLPARVGPDPYNYRFCEANNHVSRIATWSNNLCDSAQQVACVMRATAVYLEEMEETNGTETEDA